MIKMDEQQRVFGQFWGVEPMPDSVPVRTAGVNKNDVLARKLTFMPETLFFTRNLLFKKRICRIHAGCMHARNKIKNTITSFLNTRHSE